MLTTLHGFFFEQVNGSWRSCNPSCFKMVVFNKSWLIVNTFLERCLPFLWCVWPTGFLSPGNNYPQLCKLGLLPVLPGWLKLCSSVWFLALQCNTLKATVLLKQSVWVMQHASLIWNNKWGLASNQMPCLCHNTTIAVLLFYIVLATVHSCRSCSECFPCKWLIREPTLTSTSMQNSWARSSIIVTVYKIINSLFFLLACWDLSQEAWSLRADSP